MLDHLITGGTVVDGTGSAPRPADVGIRDGRIVAVAEPGTITEEAAETFDATGLLVIPGVIDPHTHYDAQLFWDPGASPSNVHGVTTVIGGNCGFTLAPLKAEDAAYTREFMASVEGMSVAALEAGVPWNWETFAEYLERLEETGIGVNAALTPMPVSSSRSRYSANVSQFHGTPSSRAATDMPSTEAMNSRVYAASSACRGASVNPQLPPITVVTPCTFDGDAPGSQNS